MLSINLQEATMAISFSKLRIRTTNDLMGKNRKAINAMNIYISSPNLYGILYSFGSVSLSIISYLTSIGNPKIDILHFMKRLKTVNVLSLSYELGCFSIDALGTKVWTLLPLSYKKLIPVSH